MSKVDQIAAELLKKSSQLRNASIESIESIRGDASSRQYFRLCLSGASPASVILMILSDCPGPVISGFANKDQNACFVELGRFLKDQGIAVPSLIYDGREQMALLVEDLGDVCLWNVVCDELGHVEQSVRAKLLQASPSDYMRKAIDLIVTLQSIPSESDCIAFNREMDFDVYRAESMRFVEYYLKSKAVEPIVIAEVERHIDILSEILASLPKKLSHRDFMAWNLMLDSNQTLRVIDHQDALLSSIFYDLVSLLHDRDIDQALGYQEITELIAYFKNRQLLGLENFNRDYNLALLQRHLKIAGQFTNLAREPGRESYLAWVAGSVKRLGSALAHIPELSGLLDVLSTVEPLVTQGADSTWEMPQ